MRICHVCSDFHPFTGGCETHNVSVTTFLASRGHEIDVVVVRPSWKDLDIKNYTDDKLAFLRAPAYDFPSHTRLRVHNICSSGPILTYIEIRKKVKELESRKGRFDVIEVHTHPFALAFPLRRVVLTLHFYELSCPRSPPIACPECKGPSDCVACVGRARYVQWRITRDLSLRRTEKIIAKYDRVAREAVSRGGVRLEAFHIIPHWIDVEGIWESSRNGNRPLIDGIDGNDIVYGFLGRLDAINGIFLILDAFKTIAERDKDAKLLFIGDGQDRNELEERIRKYGLLDRVYISGYIQHNQIGSYLGIPDVFICASRLGNYNWSLLEIMAAEKPVIATKIGGVEDILIDGENSIMCEADLESILENMVRLRKDETLRNHIAKNALETVRAKHSLTNLTEYERMLQETTEKR